MHRSLFRFDRMHRMQTFLCPCTHEYVQTSTSLHVLKHTHVWGSRRLPCIDCIIFASFPNIICPRESCSGLLPMTQRCCVGTLDGGFLRHLYRRLGHTESIAAPAGCEATPLSLAATLLSLRLCLSSPSSLFTAPFSTFRTPSLQY